MSKEAPHDGIYFLRFPTTCANLPLDQIYFSAMEKHGIKKIKIIKKAELIQASFIFLFRFSLISHFPYLPIGCYDFHLVPKYIILRSTLIYSFTRAKSTLKYQMVLVIDCVIDQIKAWQFYKTNSTK